MYYSRCGLPTVVALLLLRAPFLHISTELRLYMRPLVLPELEKLCCRPATYQPAQLLWARELNECHRVRAHALLPATDVGPLGLPRQQIFHFYRASALPAGRRKVTYTDQHSQRLSRNKSHPSQWACCRRMHHIAITAIQVRLSARGAEEGVQVSVRFWKP